MFAKLFHVTRYSPKASTIKLARTKCVHFKRLGSQFTRELIRGWLIKIHDLNDALSGGLDRKHDAFL